MADETTLRTGERFSPEQEFVIIAMHIITIQNP